MPPTKKAKASGPLPDNALAKQALETIAAIEREADQKKQAQLESLESAKAAILERMNELTHQLAQIDKAVAAITGRPAPTREKRTRRDLSEVRERVGRWMEGRKGQQFSAGDLQREFAELEDVAVSVFMKPLIEEGKVQTDTSEGIRRMKYFVSESA
ncbi:MAG TPA: hypothetical protein VHM90_16675 [Phycisphaerae bacterium]|jgi:hypothetical protein|nr:hypothetical protein [Phycisphaerae bacterium]